ncbi:MAG: hypothetical protein JWM98_775 [Thermoleophilia bacterium]|nr:hypothetical protein [Thermoleophilia bacterium]
MHLTSTPAATPAQRAIARYGDILAKLGSPEVAATGDATVRLTYGTAASAANADALLKDAVLGARLVVGDRSGSTEHPAVTTAGIVELLRGVPGVSVDIAGSTEPGRTGVWVTSGDADVSDQLGALVEQFPTPDTNVMVFVP